MKTYLTQIKHLRNASDCIQDAVDLAFADGDKMSQGRMYALQDAITAQISILLRKDNKHTTDDTADNWDHLTDPLVETAETSNDENSGVICLTTDED